MNPEMQAALDQMEPAVRKAFLEAIDRITSQAQLALLEEAIRAGDVQRALAILNIDRTFFAPLDRAISEAFWRGGVLALAGLPMLKDPFLAGVWLSVLTADTHAPKNGQSATRAT